MPNWCYTQVNVNCTSNDKAEELAKLFNEWLERGKEESDYRKQWIGSIVKHSGIGNPDEKDCPRCRGSIADISVEDNSLSFYTETAWAPMLQWLKLLVDKYDPKAEIIYTAEEPNMAIYFSNDPTIIGNVYIDSWIHDVEAIYDSSTDVARETAKKLLPDTDVEKMSFEEINELLCEKDIDVRFHEWEEVSVEQCA